MLTLSRIKSIIINNKTVLGNFSYLSILSVVTLLIPIATYPYLIRILGKEIYGIVVFAQAIIGYFVIFVSYGFNTSAVRDISLNRTNQDKVSEIVSSVLIIKGIFVVISFIILSIALLFISSAKGHFALFYLSMWLVIYDFIFPVWYFQGIERMKYITYLTLISKLLFISLIFFLIKSPQHYLRVPIINALGSIVAGLIALAIIFGQHKVQFRIQSVQTLKKYFLESTPLFISSVSVTAFVQANKVIVGAFIGMGEVACYDLAEKIVQLLKSPQMLLTQAIFPKTSKENNPVFLKRMIKISVSAAVIIFVLTQFFAERMVRILGGEGMELAVLLLRVLSIAVLFVYISQYTSVHTLLAKGYNKIWMNIIVISGLMYLSIVTIMGFTNMISPLNLVYVSLLSEIYVLIVSFYYSRKLKLI